MTLPTYTPEESALFNDLFRPELFGNSAGLPPPEADTLLPDRTNKADAVFPAKVVTITLDGSGSRRNYSVVVRASEASLVGPEVTEPVTLTVAGNSPAFEWLDGAAAAWVGARILVFLRVYADGPHFHGSVDSPAVRAAVFQARLPEAGAR